MFSRHLLVSGLVGKNKEATLVFILSEGSNRMYRNVPISLKGNYDAVHCLS